MFSRFKSNAVEKFPTNEIISCRKSALFSRLRIGTKSILRSQLSTLGK